MPPGPGEVLDLIRRGRATTRGDVREVTGLSRMTVAQRIDALLAARLIVEDGTGPATGGRRPRRLRFNVDHSTVITASVETTHTMTAVTDLAGRVMVRDRIATDVSDGPEATLHAIERSVRALLDGLGTSAPAPGGLGISLPGPIDPSTSRPSEPPLMPGWDGYPVPDQLAGSFGVPVVVSNDADAAAFGEFTTGFADTPSLCLVKVSTGIGTGIVIDGKVYHGAGGGSGDIGHVRLLDHPGAVCQCGARGCLAAVAGGRAVAAALRERGHRVSSGSDVGALLARGVPDAGRLTQEAGRVIGRVMATVVCLLDPAVLLVGGALASAPLLAGVRESLYPLSPPRATRHLTLQLATLGEDAATTGLARLVVEHELAPAVVDARLA